MKRFEAGIGIGAGGGGDQPPGKQQHAEIQGRAGDAMHDRHHHRQHRLVDLQMRRQRARCAGGVRAPPIRPSAVSFISAANAALYFFKYETRSCILPCGICVLRSQPSSNKKAVPCALISPTSTCSATSSRRAASRMAPSAPIWRWRRPRPASARWSRRSAPNCWCAAARASRPTQAGPHPAAARPRHPRAERAAARGPRRLRAAGWPARCGCSPTPTRSPNSCRRR